MTGIVELRQRRQALSKTFRDGDGALYLLVCDAGDHGLTFEAFGPHVPDGIGDPPPLVWPEGGFDVGAARGWGEAERHLAALVSLRAEAGRSASPTMGA